MEELKQVIQDLENQIKKLDENNCSPLSKKYLRTVNKLFEHKILLANINK